MSYIRSGGGQVTDRPQGSPEELQRKRERAVDLLKQGLTQAEIAASSRLTRAASAVGSVPSAALAKLLSEPFQPSGIDPPKLTPKQRQQLEKQLLRGAQAAGFGTDLWTCPAGSPSTSSAASVCAITFITLVGCCTP